MSVLNRVPNSSGAGTGMPVRLAPVALDALDQWRESRGLSRPQALARLIAEGCRYADADKDKLRTKVS